MAKYSVIIINADQEPVGDAQIVEADSPRDVADIVAQQRGMTREQFVSEAGLTLRLRELVASTVQGP